MLTVCPARPAPLHSCGILDSHPTVSPICPAIGLYFTTSHSWTLFRDSNTPRWCQASAALLNPLGLQNQHHMETFTHKEILKALRSCIPFQAQRETDKRRVLVQQLTQQTLTMGPWGDFMISVLQMRNKRRCCESGFPGLISHTYQARTPPRSYSQ